VADPAIAAPTSRNSPCPCGSGLRYKDCHGSLAAPAAPAGARSAYRPPGEEWSHLDAAARDACGAAMETALGHQTAGRLDDAARLYRDVLARAPDSHDALHMLGVIELAKQNLDEAERLIRAALAVRPPYAAIEHNLALVHDARVARMRAQPEQLAERALPILAELALAAQVGSAMPARAPRPLRSGAVHLIGRTSARDEDDGWLLRRLAEALGSQRVSIWTADDDPPRTIAGARVMPIDAAIGSLPRGGTHVYVGLDGDCTAWATRADADRVIAIPVGAPPTVCLDQLRAIAHDGARRVDLVLPSRAMAARFGSGHAVVAPPIEPVKRCDAARPEPAYGEWTIEEPAAWPVGIAGQDRRVVAEPSDMPFVRSLAAVSGRLHVHDPGRIRYALGADPRVRFFARADGSLVRFLSSLRCYVHRAERWWNEGLAREILVAMALGVPVLCPRASSYAEYLEDGVDGVLYDSLDGALSCVTELRRAPAYAESIARAAREKAARLFEPIAIATAWRSAILADAGASQRTSGAALATARVGS
jgi:hypothetical protein